MGTMLALHIFTGDVVVPVLDIPGTSVVGALVVTAGASGV